MNATIKLNNFAYGTLLGGDVRAAAGIHFVGPTNPGQYRLTVSLIDSLGCTYESGLSRNVVVH